MYAARAQQAVLAFRSGRDPTPLLMADLRSTGGAVVPDMQTKLLSLAEAAAELDTSKATNRLLLKQLDSIIRDGTANRCAVMCLRFEDGEVLSHVVQFVPRKL